MKYNRMMAIVFIASVCSGLCTLTVFAQDQTAQEETTPPPSEGAFTLKQIPPTDMTQPAQKTPATATPTTPSTPQPVRQPHP